MPVAGPPVFLVPPGALTAGVMALTGPEGHHAAAVRRLRPGERADVSDGAGTLAEGVVTGVGKDSVTLDIHAVHTVPPPQPRLAVAQALPKGDRGELAVELMTEIGVDAVIPWAAARSITKWQAERGAKALAKWRATAREAAKQSRRAWLPEVTDLASTAALAKRVPAAYAIVLEADAPAKLHELPLPRPAKSSCWWAPREESAQLNAPSSRALARSRHASVPPCYAPRRPAPRRRPSSSRERPAGK
jgi:16S rRNA (uracil1498-N3)-methyltransferase